MTWRPLSFICSSLILLAWKRDTSANASMRRSWLLPQNTKQSVPFCWDSVLPLFLRRVGVHRKGALALFGAWNLREIVNKFCVHVCVQQGLGDLELQRKVDAHMHTLASTRLCWFLHFASTFNSHSNSLKERKCLFETASIVEIHKSCRWSWRKAHVGNCGNRCGRCRALCRRQDGPKLWGCGGQLRGFYALHVSIRTWIFMHSLYCTEYCI